MYRQTEFPGRPEDEHNDCVVRALSIAAEVPYEQVHEILTRLGRKKGKCTSDRRMDAAAAELGLKKIPRKDLPVQQFTAMLKRWGTEKPAAFAVWGHLVPVKDGMECDKWPVVKPRQIIRWIYTKV